MELFNVIPSSLFTILTSKNRDVYVNSLFVLRKSFSQDIMIEKEVLVNQIVNEMKSDLMDLDTSVEEEYKEKNLEDALSFSRYIVRRFKETGWIDTEYTRDNLSEYVTLPDYSLKMINLLFSLCHEEVHEYDAYMYSMYASLNNADIEYHDYRFISLMTVHDKMLEFEESLKSLFHNLKKRYNNLGNLKTVNQVLFDHFDSYQKNIIMQIYLPLKTKDSINRFKGAILNILTKWLRDPDVINQMVGQSIVQNRFKNPDDARADIIQRIGFIVDKLFELEELVALIDDRNNNYVSAATQKMRYLLKNDKSVKGKLTKLFDRLAIDHEKNDPNLLNIFSQTFSFDDQQYVCDYSLYSRHDATRIDDTAPQELNILPEEIANDLAKDFIEQQTSKYSHRSVIEFMHNQLADREYINSRDLEIDDIEAFIMTIYSFIKGYDSNVFYRLELLNGNIENNKFILPNMNFIRRRSQQ